MKIMAVAIALLCTGCTALESRESQAWLALHAVDTVQTLRIADSPKCFYEADSITQSLIGRTPSRGKVLAWSAGMAGVHLGVTELLLRNDHPRLARVWQYVQIGNTASAIGQNISIGIRIGAPNKRRGACAPPVTINEGGVLNEVTD